MGRRDIQFYDLYKREKAETDVEKLKEKGYLLEGILKGAYTDEKTGEEVQIEEVDEPIYGDIEVDDFNKLFRNQNLIKELYGKSIKVRLETNEDEMGVASVTRHVTEDLSRVNLNGDEIGDLECDNPNDQSCAIYSQAGYLSQAGDGFEDEDGPCKEFTDAAM